MSRRILVSKGFGAGWSTSMRGIPANFACEYKPIIDAIMYDVPLTEEHSLVLQFIEECKQKFDVDHVCVLGIEGLSVYEIEDNERYRITVNDGNESLEIESETRHNWY